MASKPTYITLREAARRLGVHESTVRRYADRGLVAAVRLPSGVRRLSSVDVERLTGSATGDHQRPAPSAKVEKLIAQQGVRPISDPDELAAPHLWGSDEELERFLAMTYAERDRDR
jgi:excisionase family DNA binding protein